MPLQPTRDEPRRRGRSRSYVLGLKRPEGRAPGAKHIRKAADPDLSTSLERFNQNCGCAGARALARFNVIFLGGIEAA